MTKWFYLELNTTDGAKVQIYPPFKSECIQTEPNEYDDIFYQLELAGEELTVPEFYAYNTEKEALAGLLKNFRYFFKWHSNENNAPASNSDIYEQKIQKCYRELREKYSDELPELFI
jgi:hypothetical protein